MPGFVGVHRNPWRWRAVLYQREARHGTAGCLLSVLLLAPLFVRQYGLCAVAVACAVHAVVVVPALAGYFSLAAVAARTFRLLRSAVVARPPSGGHGRAPTASAPLLILLLGLPFVMLLLRGSEAGLLLGGGLYCLLGAPLALLGQLPGGPASLTTALRALLSAAVRLALLLGGVLCCAVSAPVLYAAHLCVETASALHRALQLCTAAPCLHQLLFFVHLQHLLLPPTHLPLTALLHLLGCYTCLYICSSLQVWRCCGRRLVVAGVLCAAICVGWCRVELCTACYSAACSAYFLLTASEDPDGGLAPPLQLRPWLEEEEVVVAVRAMPPVASLLLLLGACVWAQEAAPLGGSRLTHAAVSLLALYCNVLLPLLRLLQESRRLLVGGVGGYRRACAQDCTRQDTCAVCLEALHGGRVTACGHVYHTPCLRRLLEAGLTRCALCNAPLPPHCPASR